MIPIIILAILGVDLHICLVMYIMYLTSWRYHNSTSWKLIPQSDLNFLSGIASILKSSFLRLFQKAYILTQRRLRIIKDQIRAKATKKPNKNANLATAKSNVLS